MACNFQGCAKLTDLDLDLDISPAGPIRHQRRGGSVFLALVALAEVQAEIVHACAYHVFTERVPVTHSLDKERMFVVIGCSFRHFETP